jgi:hypothetical protein
VTNQFGSFGNRCLASGFEPDLSKMHPFDPVMGMPLGIQWLYAFLQDEDGNIYCPERKFISTLTGGLFLMTNESGTLNINTASGKGYRGELKRENDADRRRWHKPVFHRMPAGTVPEGEQDFILELRNDTMEYSEGDLIDLAGPSAGLGMQFYDSRPEAPLFYSSLCYWLKGEVLGKRVEGPFFFDHVYWPAGRDWKEYEYYLKTQIGWEVFANKYDDGTIQWGHFVNGIDGFNPGVVIEGDQVLAASGDVRASFVLNEGGWVTALEHDLDGEVFEFVGDELGWMRQFSESRQQGHDDYRAQYGKTRPVDEKRRLVAGFTWLECFAERIKGAGMVVDKLSSRVSV